MAKGAKAFALESSAEIITGALRPVSSMKSPPPTLPAGYTAMRFTCGLSCTM